MSAFLSTAITILLAVIVFGVMIMIHELGHFMSAKWLGAGVKEFAIGMGPAIFKHKGKETTYSLRILPIGGFVNLEGEDEDSDSPTAFNNLARWRRFIILFAGAFMNIVLGLVIVMIIVVNTPVLASNNIDVFKEGATSNSYGLAPGDELVSINGYRVYIDTDISFAIVSNQTNDYTIKVKRTVDGVKKTVELKHVKFPVYHDATYGDVFMPDFYLQRAQKNFITVFNTAIGRTISVIRSVIRSLVMLVTGKIGTDKLSGPVGITQEIGNAAKRGFEDFIYIFAMLTLNLGIMNLLPLPALDGGRIAFLLVEAVRRKPLNPKYEGVIHLVGFALLILLMVFVSYNDIVRLFK